MLTLDIQSKEDLIQETKEAYKIVVDYIESLNEEELIYTPDQRWSPLEQLEHLILSSKGVASALKMPKEQLATFGVSDRSSHTYNELVEIYEKALGTGKKAPDAFTPNASQPLVKEVLLNNWKMIGSKLGARIESWSEEDLDRLQLPHPAIGLITIREMLYFTILHARHHLETMRALFA